LVKFNSIDFKGIQLSDAYISTRNLPVNLRKEDEFLFQHELICEVQSCYLIELENIFYSGYGLVKISSKRTLPESFLVYNLIHRHPFFHFL
jgi:hypothetical protein